MAVDTEEAECRQQQGGETEADAILRHRSKAKPTSPQNIKLRVPANAGQAEASPATACQDSPAKSAGL